MNLLKGSDSRTNLIRKNVFLSFVIKGWSGLVQLLLVPVTLFCLGNYENGIWMTISSILVWIDSLDIGLGNGLRNRLAADMARGDTQGARECVSTTFIMLVFIIVPVALCLIAAIYAGNPYGWLNVSPEMVTGLRSVLVTAVSFVCATFIFKTIGNVYLAMQLPAVNNALVVGGQTLSLLLMYALRLNGIHSLELTAVAYTMSPLLVYLVAYPITFYRKYPFLRPSLACFRKGLVRELLGMGVQFFILQIAGAVLFASSNILISRRFSPELVTPYQVAYRYFSFAMMIFTVIASPYWSATTDAYERRDYKWIKASMKRIHRILYLEAAILLLMLAISGQVYAIWVGEGVQIKASTSILMAAYVLVITYSVGYSYFLNGMGVLHLQLVMTVGAAVLFFPVSALLCRFLGVDGIIAALILVNVPGAVTNTVQFNRRINVKGVKK